MPELTMDINNAARNIFNACIDLDFMDYDNCEQVKVDILTALYRIEELTENEGKYWKTFYKSLERIFDTEV